MFRELVFLSVGLGALAEWELVPVMPEKRGTFTLCGQALTSHLNMVCGNIFASPFKKSLGEPLYLDYESNDSEENEKRKYRFPFSPRSKALSILEYRRIKRGVSDECCKKSCTLSELRGYCGRRA